MRSGVEKDMKSYLKIMSTDQRELFPIKLKTTQ